MRFKLECSEQDGEELCSSREESEQNDIPELNTSPINTGKAAVPEETQYPASISIDVLLKAGQLIKPKRKNQVSLSLERFNIKEQEWVSVEKSLDLLVETESFSSGGFRNAFLGVCKDEQKWVIKKYNDKAVETITETLKSSVEDHTRKQIQMHCAARYLTNIFSTKATVNVSSSTVHTAQYTKDSQQQSNNSLKGHLRSMSITMEKCANNLRVAVLTSRPFLRRLNA